MLPNITGYRVAYGGAWVLVGDDEEAFVACCGPFDTPRPHTNNMACWYEAGAIGAATVYRMAS